MNRGIKEWRKEERKRKRSEGSKGEERCGEERKVFRTRMTPELLRGHWWPDESECESILPLTREGSCSVIRESAHRASAAPCPDMI